MTIKTTLHVGYCGGSGGFLFLHLLLLSDKYCLRFSNKASDAKKIIDQQWNIATPNLWKSSETWPNNFNTVMAETDLDKILYFCNPTNEEFFDCQKDFFKSFKQSYNNTKDPSWPDVNSFAEFNKLPLWIQSETFDHLGINNLANLDSYCDPVKTQKKFIWVYTDINSQNELAFYKKAYWYNWTPNVDKITDLSKFSDMWNDTLVDQKAVEFLNKSDLQIKLQNLVNDPEILIRHGLVNDITQEQIKLLTKWKSLHPPDLLKLIGINTSI